MKRIRYVKGPNAGEFTSMQVMNSDVGEVKSRIFVGGKTGAILSAKDESIIVSAKGTSPHAIKIQLKAALHDLGVKFNGEERERNVERVQDHTDVSEGTDTE